MFTGVATIGCCCLSVIRRTPPCVSVCVCVFTPVFVCLSVAGVATVEQCCTRGVHSHVYDVTEKTGNGRHPLCWHRNVCVFTLHYIRVSLVM